MSDDVRHGFFWTTQDGEIIGPVDESLDWETFTLEMTFLPGGGVGIVWEPDAPEGDPRRGLKDPR